MSQSEERLVGAPPPHAFEIRPDDGSEEVLVFPQPREVTRRGGPPFRGDHRTVIVVPQQAGPDDLRSATCLADRICGATQHRPEIVRGEAPSGRCAIVLGQAQQLADVPGLSAAEQPGAEGYLLASAPQQVVICGTDPAGLFWGVQTLLQLARITPTGHLRIPAMQIRDWPALRHRGVFVECTWGSDLMELADWKSCLDVLSELKINALGVGLYGCWGESFRRAVTEFMMVPIPGRPELCSEKTIEYYSPQARAWRELTYLPPMYSQDFLGEVVAYGRERQVTVTPYFNSLGHNRLIPRLYPEVSVKTAQGAPTHQGFCTSRPLTYEILFDCYDHIIDQYLTPHGVDTFHLQMDEVSEWCECPECRQTPPGERYVQHLLKLAEHLAAKGMRHIVAWNDMLLRHDQLSESLLETLEQRGLKDKLILHWFMYGPQVWDSLQPQLGLRAWMAPMTGFQHNYLAAWHISHLRNIYQMLRLGHRDGAEGAESYALYDYGYHRGHCALAEFSWNPPSGPDREGEDVDEFLRRYARRFFGPQWREALNALEALDEAYEESLTQGRTVLHKLTHYEYSYRPPPTYPNTPYPEEPLRLLRQDAEHQRKLVRVAARLGEIKRLVGGWDRGQLEAPLVADNLEAESTRWANLAEVFLTLLSLEEDYQRLRECAADDRERAWGLLRGLIEQAEAVQGLQMEAMTKWEQAKAPYLHPHNLRVMSLIKRLGEELAQTLGQVRDSLAAGAEAATLPDELIRGTYADY